MQVVVKTPPIKFSIHSDHDVPTAFMQKLANFIQSEYQSDIQVIYDNDEELVDITETRWYQKMERKRTPGTTVKVYRQN